MMLRIVLGKTAEVYVVHSCDQWAWAARSNSSAAETYLDPKHGLKGRWDIRIAMSWR